MSDLRSRGSYLNDKFLADLAPRISRVSGDDRENHFFCFNVFLFCYFGLILFCYTTVLSWTTARDINLSILPCNYTCCTVKQCQRLAVNQHIPTTVSLLSIHSVKCCRMVSSNAKLILE